MQVSFAEILGAVEQRQASLPGELAGYLTLAVADCLLNAPHHLAFEQLWLMEEGRVGCSGGAPAMDAAVEGELRRLLQVLLIGSNSITPALLRASQRSDEMGIRGLVRELETALIPVNRSAARRALARLYREVASARAAGRVSRSPLSPLELKPPRPPTPVPAAVYEISFTDLGSAPHVEPTSGVPGSASQLSPSIPVTVEIPETMIPDLEIPMAHSRTRGGMAEGEQVPDEELVDPMSGEEEVAPTSARSILTEEGFEVLEDVADPDSPVEFIECVEVTASLPLSVASCQPGCASGEGQPPSASRLGSCISGYTQPLPEVTSRGEGYTLPLPQVIVALPHSASPAIPEGFSFSEEFEPTRVEAPVAYVESQVPPGATTLQSSRQAQFQRELEGLKEPIEREVLLGLEEVNAQGDHFGVGELDGLEEVDGLEELEELDGLEVSEPLPTAKPGASACPASQISHGFVPVAVRPQLTPIFYPPHRPRDFEELERAFLVPEASDEGELCRGLRKSVGLDLTPLPPLNASLTPPPVVETREAISLSETAPFPLTRTLGRVGVGVMSLLIVGATMLVGRDQHLVANAAETGPEGKPSLVGEHPTNASPDLLRGQAREASPSPCRLRVEFDGLQPYQSAHLRQPDRSERVLPVHRSGRFLTFQGLDCEKSAEVVVEDPLTRAWQRLPLAAPLRQSPKADQAAVVATLQPR